MSKKVKIVCKNTNYHGKSMNLPDVGAVNISEEGEVEVSEEIAEQLTDGPDWDYAGKAPVKAKKAAKVEETEEETEEESTEETEEEEEEQPDAEQVDKDLKKALIKKFTGSNAEEELKDLAAKSGVSKSVIGKAKGKTDLITMILNKLELSEKVELLKAQPNAD